MGLVVSEKEKKFLKVMVILVIIAIGASFYEQSNRNSPKKIASQKTLEAQIATKKLLKDPSSVQWHDVVYVAKTGAVCGYVNAKNSFGGYTGRKPFVYFASMSTISDNSKNFTDMWNKMCT